MGGCWHSLQLLIPARVLLSWPSQDGHTQINEEVWKPSACYLKAGFFSWQVSGRKTKPSQRSVEGEIYYYLQQVRTLGIFPKAVSLWRAKLGKSSAKGTYILMKVFEQRKIQHRIENSVSNWGKDRQRPSFSWLKSGGSSQHFFCLPHGKEP